jgi:LytS/YehU family sensor histidine kinase
MLVRPLVTRVVVGMVISILAALAFFVLVPSLQAPVLTRQVITLLWCAIYFGLEANETRRRAEREAAENISRAAFAEAAARQNELRHLEARMNPHFLFNALNCIVAASHDHVAVERVTQDLADYLRFSLTPSRPLEPLSRELDALEKYLAIQQSRFGDDLVCRISCAPEARSVAVPPMMIQPLLENAFHYGAQTSPMPLTVSVTASVRDGALCMIVANSGSWVPPDPARSIGSGIQTLRKRLELLFGPAATADVCREEGWVRVVIRLPVAGRHADQGIPTATTA